MPAGSRYAAGNTEMESERQRTCLQPICGRIFKIRLPFRAKKTGKKYPKFDFAHWWNGEGLKGQGWKQWQGTTGGNRMLLITSLKTSRSVRRHVRYGDVLLQQHPVLIKTPEAEAGFKTCH